MKEYKVRVTQVGMSSAINIESILREEVKEGWDMRQIVTNEATDQYMIIFERNEK